MNIFPKADAQLEAPPPNDHRPNSGLREGDITHAEVNEALRIAPKTVIFGQQTRLRLGLLMEDEQLPRLHAGHDMVKFFYGAIRVNIGAQGNLRFCGCRRWLTVNSLGFWMSRCFIFHIPQDCYTVAAGTPRSRGLRGQWNFCSPVISARCSSDSVCAKSGSGS